METPKKPVRKPIAKPIEDEDDSDDLAELSTSKKKTLDDDDDDLPIDDLGGYDEIGFDEDEDEDF